MDQVVTYAGGVLGGYVLAAVPLSGTWLAPAAPVLHVIGAIAMIVFAGALIWKSARALIGK